MSHNAARSAELVIRILLVGTLAVLTVGAFLLRVERIHGPAGTMREDEARLVLAAGGVMNTGVPTMPSGKLYFRGVVNTYLSAGSMALLGRRDFAARLPNALLGPILVPLLFLFGRRLGGTTAGLCLAGFVAVQPELIRWSANAWMTGLFIVAFVAAAFPLSLGFERDQPRAQVLGGAAAVLAVLVHEFGALLFLAVLVTLAVRALRRDFGWFAGRRSVIALSLLGCSLVLFVALGLFLRSQTVSGPTGEFRHYFGPHLSLDRFDMDYARWSGAYAPIALSALMGIPLLLRSPKSGGLFLYALTAVTMGAVWVVIDKTSERYGLLLFPLLALTATWALAEAARLIGARLQLRNRAIERLRATAIVAVFALALARDLSATRFRYAPPRQTWLSELRALGFSPDDLVLTDNAEAPAWYLGRVDYWERGENYARYTYRSGGELRHLYTGALRVHTQEDFAEIVRTNPGKQLWYLGEEDGLREFPAELRERIFRAADRRRRTQDDVLILRLPLDSPGLRPPDAERAGKPPSRAPAP